LRSHRHVLLASAASVAALTGILFVPASASAKPATTPATPTITLTLSPATVDYGNQSVTASGTVTTSAGPVAGAAVTVLYVNVNKQAAQLSLTTGTDGSYSGTIPDPETAAQTVTATVAATSSTTSASTSAQLGFTTDAVTITASFTPAYVNVGSTGTLTGVASYISGGTAYPLANSTLSITSPQNLNWPPISATVTTAADGSFSYVTPTVPVGVDSLQFTVSSAATPYLDAGQVSVTMFLNMAVEWDAFDGTLGAHHVLRFLTCAGFPFPLANAPLASPPDYQYSTSPNGPWQTLGVATSVNYGSCSLDDEGDGTYTATFTAPLANAYYRAYAPAVPGQMSSASQPIHLQRYRTRITGFTITPRRVRHGGKITISGRLWHLTGTWLPDTGRLIDIEFRYNNKTYTLAHRLTTNSAGWFRGVFAVPHTASWLAAYKGESDDFAVTSKAITVRVR
jgi:hypothetical protein